MRSIASSGEALVRRADYSFIGQVVAVGFAIHGIDLIYRPAAFIVGGIVAVLALEMRGRK